KFPDGGRALRQRDLASALNASGDVAQFVATRDTVTGLEHIFSGSELREKGMRFDLGGYQCHVFLDWKHLRDDLNHPWRELYEHLRGKGVASLADAMRDLQLKPVHDALRALLDPPLIASLFEVTAPQSGQAGKKTAPAPETAAVSTMKTPPALPAQATAIGDGHALQRRKEALDLLALRVQAMLQAAQSLVLGESAESLGVPAQSQWQGSVEAALASFTRKVEAARRIPSLEKHFRVAWSTHACSVLPNDAARENLARWATVIAWAALHALGELLSVSEPEQAGAKLFDALRLREPLADAFSRFGLEDEGKWRASARARAVLANEAWLPGAPRSAKSPHSWLHDPDVLWLINVHDYQGVRYFNKEMYECLLWWMALPALIRIAESPTPDPQKLHELELQIESRIDAAEAAGYQIMALFELGEGSVPKEPPPVADDDQPPINEAEEEEITPKGRRTPK
ncbi:MAG: hypothetical protein DMG60_03120, partial [Acidobacteria bacterium]